MSGLFSLLFGILMVAFVYWPASALGFVYWIVNQGFKAGFDGADSFFKD